VGARAARASIAVTDFGFACGIGSIVRLSIGVCARAPVNEPNVARSAVFAVVRSNCHRFMLPPPCLPWKLRPGAAGRSGTRHGM
jgi:hypothetical protein